MAEEPAGATRLRGHSVLIAEDDPISRAYLVQVLRSSGLEIHEARDGQEALELLGSRRVDLMLLDIHMPRLRGDELANRIRAGETGPGHRDIPLFAVTAYSSPEERRGYLGAGFTEVYGKPVAAEELLAAILRYLAGQSCVDPEDADAVSYNLTGFLREFSAHPEVLSEILRVFRLEVPERLSALRQAMEDRDSFRVSRIAHSLGSTAATFHAYDAQAVARRCEDYVKAGETDEAIREAEELICHLQIVLAHVEKLSSHDAPESVGLVRRTPS